MNHALASLFHPSAPHVHLPGTSILSALSLSANYEGRPALINVSFEINTGERMAVVGPNGAGKSTLFRLISGVMKPSSGSINVYGAEPGGHICIAYLPQRSNVDWNFPISVEEAIMMGRTRKMGMFQWATKKDREIVNRALSTVGMEAFAKRQIGQLSGGQQQRMFIARALAQEAELVLMDEPVSGLDTPSQEELFSILDRLRADKVTIMLALHDLDLAARQFDRIMLLNHKLVAIGNASKVLRIENLKEAYGERAQALTNEHSLIVLDDDCCSGQEGEHA